MLRRLLFRAGIAAIAVSLPACAGLYPALYTRPEPALGGRSASGIEDGNGATAVPEIPQAPREARQTLTVATVNMRHGLPRFEHLEQRKELVLAEFGRLAPDVILLQEVPVLRSRRDQIGPWLADELGYNLVYARANGRASWLGFEEGEAVLSRYPIREAQRHVLLPKPGLIESRIVLRVLINTPLGGLEVYNTHLSHRVDRDPLRRRQVEDLVRFLQATYRLRELPAVIGGRFQRAAGFSADRPSTAGGLSGRGSARRYPADGPTSWLDDITDPADSP